MNSRAEKKFLTFNKHEGSIDNRVINAIIEENPKKQGQRTPILKPFFHRNSQNFELVQTIWVDKFWGISVIIGQFISAHFGTVSPLSMFSIIQQKTSLHIQIPNIYLGSGIESGI
jgi:hypothetical protein